MIDDVLGIPDQLRDALWRIESARLQPGEAAGVIVVCGMGGSAIGAELAAAALGDRLTAADARRSAATSCRAGRRRSGRCSARATPGDTEETLACFDGGRGGRRPPLRRQHRRPAGRRGPRGRGRRWSACRASSSRAPPSPTCSSSPPRWRRWPGSRRASTPRSTPPPPSSTEQPRRLQAAAAEIAAADRRAPIPVIYGAGLTAPVARRWKTQVNENAKHPAFCAELPEADHNELCGWSGAVARASDSPRSSSRTATSTRASAAASS